jgi:hypothetical protein
MLYFARNLRKASHCCSVSTYGFHCLGLEEKIWKVFAPSL